MGVFLNWKKMPPIFQFGVLLLALEACYMFYWFGVMWYILYNGTEVYRTFHAFLSLHMVTNPIALFYIIEARKKSPYWFLIWPFVAVLFFDTATLAYMISLLDRSLVPGFGLEVAATIWTFGLSVLIFIWYFVVLIQNARETETPPKMRATPLLRNPNY